jgi:ribosomal protein S18 acetylase RimI-like enzyme
MSQPPPIKRPPSARPRRPTTDDAPPRPPDADELSAIERSQARLVELAGARRIEEAALGATVLVWPGRGPAFNHATCLRWSTADWPDRAAAVGDRLVAGGEAPCLVVSDGLTTPPDLAERLAASGWLEIGRETVMWTRRAAAVPHLDAPLRLEAVTVAGVDRYEAIEREIFGLSEREAPDRRQALAEALEAASLRVYLVREAGLPVATARLHVEGGLAAIHGLGVVASARRRGLGAYLTTIVTRAGLALGVSLVWLSVDPDNAPAMALYAGLDYRPAFSWQRLIRLG